MQAQQLATPAPVDTEPLRPVERADPAPAAGELQIELTTCAVCRTDLQLCEGDLAPRRRPIVPGHQAVGRVAALGSGVSGWAMGDRVGVAWLAGTCGSCRFCTSDRENLCERAEFTGWDRDGGYATHMTARADFALALPFERSDEELAPLLCGGVIGYRALKISQIAPGGRLGLWGFGASALLTIQVALHWGCEVFVATRNEAEQRHALDMGAAWAGSSHEPPPVPLDAAITFAPVGEVVVAALTAVDRGGVVAINAIHLDRIPQFPYESLWWERQLRSVANFTRRDAVEFLELAAEIPVTTSFETFPLAQANAALRRLRDGEIGGAAVLSVMD